MRDALVIGAVYAGMILPPWNVFWWVVAGVAYKLDKDTSGDGALAVVAFPGVMAGMSVDWTLKKLGVP